MYDFDILIDTTADLDEAFQTKYDIKVLPAHLVIDGKDTLSFLKWERMSREDFYTQLKADPARFSTAPPSVGEMAAAIEEIVAQGRGVLYPTISSGISGTYNFAVQAKAAVLEKHPDARVEIVDTLRFGPAIGLIAVNAAIMRADGKGIGEVAENIESTKNRYHQAGWLDDLSFVAKQGRLTHSKAFFGKLVGIKPIGEFDYNGLTTVIGKIKGEKAAFDALMNYIEKTIENPQNQIVFIAQSNRLKQAEKYKAMIEERFHPKEVCIKDVFPSCGTNVGPGLMAAYYIGAPISRDLSFERGILEAFNG